MSKIASSRFACKFPTAAALATGLAAAAPAFAADPIIDPMRPNEGPTASAPRQAEREMKRDLERAPTLTERFGLPPVSGPLPPLLPPLRQEPVLQTPGPDALPPPLPPSLRARRPRDRDG
ncbi:MAG TPA: hypothetical protein VIF14_00260 [Alphaproteobacteria bacterium]|jgi:hypothetical protein